MTARRIVALSAGLGRPSSTRMLAERLGEATVAALREQGVDARLEIVELRDVAHPIVDAMLTGFPSGPLRDVVDAVAGADAVVAVSPVFTASYSGLFKSFVDVLDPDALRGVPVLLGATGGTVRHSLALDHALRPLFAYLRADVATTAVFAATDDWATGSAAGAATSSGDGREAGSGETRADGGPLGERIRRAGRELAATVAARTPRVTQDPFGDVPSFESLLG
ncbi:CE1759 family FMN reductase [Cellulomonas sp. PhB143]|uniref:CE1759 family FMN reductase n=1 Tax=Cellulomonas sp. PhB143 TaxID=2485186 RepID=UPI000F49F724|nr:CE1759 family FMN reductase [Cellulomonas sp. PhB143]ROS73659.1 FMN reductase [Cellulomonas sp. PhB143]